MTGRSAARSCCWWDALNCGHKDGYTNAMIYRAWRCLAELEALLGRVKQQEHFTDLAERLATTHRAYWHCAQRSDGGCRSTSSWGAINQYRVRLRRFSERMKGFLLSHW